MNPEWPTVALGEIADVFSGNSAPQGKHAFDPEGPVFIRTSDVGAVHVGEISSSRDRLADGVGTKFREFPPGTVLFPKSGASTFSNHRVITTVPAFVSSHLAGVVANDRKVLARFLFYSLQTIDAKTLVQDQGYPSLTIRTIAAIPICLPPLEEQRRIVKVLDEAFEHIATAKANAEKNLRNARALVENHLQSVFTQRGPGWVEQPLGSFCSLENGDRGTNYPSKSARTVTGVPFINAGHLTDDGIDLETLDYISRDRFNLLGNGKIRKGDILFCLRGSLGKFAGVGGLHEGAIASSLVIVRPDETVLNEFVVAYFRSPLCSEMISQFKSGTAQPNLSAQSLRKFIVPVPPLQEQEAVVRKLADLRAGTQHLESVYQQKIAALKALKKSMLRQALTGQFGAHAA